MGSCSISSGAVGLAHLALFCALELESLSCPSALQVFQLFSFSISTWVGHGERFHRQMEETASSDVEDYWITGFLDHISCGEPGEEAKAAISSLHSVNSGNPRRDM